MRRYFQKKSGRQIDKQFFFNKTFEMAVFFLPFKDIKKRFKKPLKQSCYEGTDRWIDRWTDGLTKKWLIESHSMQLKNAQHFFVSLLLLWKPKDTQITSRFGPIQNQTTWPVFWPIQARIVPEG